MHGSTWFFGFFVTFRFFRSQLLLDLRGDLLLQKELDPDEQYLQALQENHFHNQTANLIWIEAKEKIKVSWFTDSRSNFQLLIHSWIYSLFCIYNSLFISFSSSYSSFLNWLSSRWVSIKNFLENCLPVNSWLGAW